MVNEPKHGTEVKQVTNMEKQQGGATQSCLLTRPSSQSTQRVPVERIEKPSVAVPASIQRLDQQDGLTHINIDRLAHTQLGVMLTHTHRSPFEHPKFGCFLSVEGYIGFIRSGGRNALHRDTFGMNARHLSQNQEMIFVQGFREFVMEANYLKIKQTPELCELFLKSTLPFDHYYVIEKEDRIDRPHNASWLIESFENLRKTMKRGEVYRAPSYEAVEAAGRTYNQLMQSSKR
jgi:hypothetical protein